MTAVRRFRQQRDGEWIEPMAGYRMCCCDCGLVHELEFRLVRGKIQFRAWRRQRDTARERGKGRYKLRA